MEDLFVSMHEIKKELTQIERDVDTLIEQSSVMKFNLSLLIKEIEDNFNQIKLCNTRKDAKDYFNYLYKVHVILDSIEFKNGLIIEKRLSRFVSDFDNFDMAE